MKIGCGLKTRGDYLHDLKNSQAKLERSFGLYYIVRRTVSNGPTGGLNHEPTVRFSHGISAECIEPGGPGAIPARHFRSGYPSYCPFDCARGSARHGLPRSSERHFGYGARAELVFLRPNGRHGPARAPAFYYRPHPPDETGRQVHDVVVYPIRKPVRGGETGAATDAVRRRASATGWRKRRPGARSNSKRGQLPDGEDAE